MRNAATLSEAAEKKSTIARKGGQWSKAAHLTAADAHKYAKLAHKAEGNAERTLEHEAKETFHREQAAR